MKVGRAEFDKIALHCVQVIGFPANDGKQQLIILGDISNAGICGCASCDCQREHFGVWSDLLWSHYQKRMGAPDLERKAPKNWEEPNY